MVFRENFIAVVKCGGKILREFDGVVKLPFGSEYTILLKNKEGRRAVVDVEIDGKDVLSGRQLLIDSNSDLELKGFLENQVVKNSFKFIQKTKEIADYRGDFVDDGIIRVSFKYEVPVQEVTRWRYHDYWQYPLKPYTPWYPPYDPYITYYNYPTRTTFTTTGGTVGVASGTISCSNSPSVNVFCNSVVTPTKEEGITVKGSEVNQNFSTQYVGELEQNSKVILIRLSGYLATGKIVEKPKTVSKKVRCTTCGRKLNSNTKFCNNCGTAVV